MTISFLDFIPQGVQLLIEWLLQAVTSNYGWAVVLFTVIIKVVLSPLDIWQRVSMASNNRKMKRIKPQLDQISKKYANDQQMMYAKQNELYKKENIKLMGGCLPMILTLIIFFSVFSGFNQMTRNQAIEAYTEVYTTYTQAYNEAMANSNDVVVGYQAGEAAVLAKDDEDPFFKGWLHIGNIFVSDTPWSSKLPTYDTYVGTGMGSLGIKDTDFGEGVVFSADEYNRVMKALEDKYAGQVNGYLILPLLAVALSWLSQWLSRKGQPQVEGAAGSGKGMQIVMVGMMGVFALFYSSAFAIYMVISQVYSIILQVIFNAVNKYLDDKEQDRIMSTTFKR